MGRIALGKSDPQGAEEYFVRATELNPNNPYAFLLLGRIYIVRAGLENNPEHYLRARDYLEEASGLKGATAEAYLMLGIVYAELGDIPRAKMHAEEAINRGIQGRGLIDARTILNMK